MLLYVMCSNLYVSYIRGTQKCLGVKSASQFMRNNKSSNDFLLELLSVMSNFPPTLAYIINLQGMITINLRS